MKRRNCIPTKVTARGAPSINALRARASTTIIAVVETATNSRATKTNGVALVVVATTSKQHHNTCLYTFCVEGSGQF
jgi:hypothetical protein